MAQKLYEDMSKVMSHEEVHEAVRNYINSGGPPIEEVTQLYEENRPKHAGDSFIKFSSDKGNER